MRHPSEEQLNDYIDELLSASEQSEVRRHLDECSDCKRTVGQLRRIVEAAGALGEIEPSRDLMPGIRQSVQTPKYGWMRWAAAAAVVGFVALLAAFRFGAGSGDPEPTIESLLANFQAAEAEYIKATEMLAEGLEDRRDGIDPATLELLDANLAVVDSAIVEVRAALERDGVDVANTHMLATLYDKKMNILLRASRLSS